MDIEHYYEYRLFDAQADGTLIEVVRVGLELRLLRQDFLRSHPTDAEANLAIVRIIGAEERNIFWRGLQFYAYSMCCARCGQALGCDHCPGCGMKFVAQPTQLFPNICLPDIVRAQLELDGHVFTH